MRFAQGNNLLLFMCNIFVVLLQCHFFQDRSVLLDVSMKKLVVGSVSVFIHMHQVPLYGFH